MASNLRKGRRKISEIPDNVDGSSSETLSPQKINKASYESPQSSPIKSPLFENGENVRSQSFVAKCFYGLKRSEKKQELPSPPKVLNRSNKTEGGEWKILQDPILNEKILERIALSPVKQAVLRSCSVEEFRRLYRDEIREVEFEDKLTTGKFTGTSKIIYRRSRSDEEESEDDCVSFVDDEISFKISNRGFDVDSASDCSSTKVQSPLSLKDKNTLNESPLTKIAMDIDESDGDSVTSGNTTDNVEFSSPSQENKVTPSTNTGSERKFFKSKSVRDSINSGSVVVGKNFNLRFVTRSNSKDMKTQKRKKRMSKATPQRLSGDDKVKSPFVLPSQINNKEPVTTPISSQEKGLHHTINDEFLDNLVVNKNSKTYSLSSPKENEDEIPGTSNSLPESEQLPTGTKRANPTESHLSSNEEVAETPNNERKSSSRRLFPIFTKEKSSGIVKDDSKNSPTATKSQGMKVLKDNQSQMIIDAGQKKFGATQCKVCGMVYCHADPLDEADHSKFHNRLLEVLKFPGWKKEREVQEFPIDCGRVMMVMSDDPRYCRRKVEEMYELMERDLGFPGSVPFSNPYQKVFFYISFDRKIEGCCVAEPIKEGHRVIPGDMDSTSASGRRPWCCNKKPEPALLGISRLWVAASSRRTGVATRLVDSVRQWFDYGSLIPLHLLAFSDPTPDGRKFAEKYFGSPAFLVYKYH